MSTTTANNVIGALLADSSFNTLVAALKVKRDEVASYQSQIANFTGQLTRLNVLLASSQADEAALQSQVAAAGATIVGAHLV